MKRRQEQAGQVELALKPNQTVTIYFDGGSLGGNVGYGSYEVDGAGLKHRSIRQQFGTPITCNQAEYLSLIAALKWLRHRVNGERHIQIYTDSMLVCRQLPGRWKAKCVHIRELRDEARSLLKQYGQWSIEWRGREANVKRFGH